MAAVGAGTAAAKTAAEDRVINIKGKLRQLFLCLTLLAGSLSGVQMRPEEIEELMHSMNQPKLAHVLREEFEGSDDTIKKVIEELDGSGG